MLLRELAFSTGRSFARRRAAALEMFGSEGVFLRSGSYRTASGQSVGDRASSLAVVRAESPYPPKPGNIRVVSGERSNRRLEELV